MEFLSRQTAYLVSSFGQAESTLLSICERERQGEGEGECNDGACSEGVLLAWRVCKRMRTAMPTRCLFQREVSKQNGEEFVCALVRARRREAWEMADAAACNCIDGHACTALLPLPPPCVSLSQSHARMLCIPFLLLVSYRVDTSDNSLPLAYARLCTRATF